MPRKRSSASADRQRIDRLLKEFSRTLRAFCEHDPLVRGSFETLRRRCGKKRCRCVDGALHETFVFIDRSTGKRRIQKATVGQAQALRKPAKRYRSLKVSRARLSRIHEEILSVCDRLSEHRLRQGEKLLRRFAPKSRS
jgi:hypothetical protein